MRKWMMASVMVLGLAACGQGSADKGPESPEAANDTQATAETSGGTAAAEGLNCNAIKAKPANGPDVVGIAMGMPVQEAYQKLACFNPAFVLEMTEPRPDGYRSIRTEYDGDDISVRLVGVPGQEQVVEINRSVRYASGREPAVDGILNQLTQKYGAFTQTNYGGGPQVTYQMVQRADGSRVSGLEDPLMRGCPYEQPEACGLTVTTNIIRAESNPGLAHNFQVIMLDQRIARRQTEIARNSESSATQQRQSQELQSAAGNAPKL